MDADITVVKASHLQPFLDYLDSVNAPVDSLLNKANLDRAQFTHPDNLIPEAPFWAFLDLVANSQGMADLGFRVTEQLSLDSFGVFGAKVMQAQSLHHALQVFISDMGQQSNCPPFWLKEMDDELWFCRLGTQGIKLGQWPVEQHVVSMMVQLVRGFTSITWSPTKVHLQTDTLIGVANTNTFLHCDITINKTITAICIPKAILQNTAILSNQFNDQNVLEQVDTIPQACYHLVEKVIEQRAELRPYKADAVSKDLGVSVRQLQRLLQKDKASFREVSEQVIFNQAKVMLEKGKMSVLEVSLELGYTDAANFTRAFKRWSGINPSAFRRSHTLSH